MRQRPFHERHPDVDLYALLGLTRHASIVAIRKAYRGRVGQLHPDRYAAETVEVRSHAEHWMKILNEAIDVLGDEARRRAYDEHHRSKFRTPAPAAPPPPDRGRRRSSGKTRRPSSKTKTPRAAEADRAAEAAAEAIRAAAATLGKGPPGIAQFERCDCLDDVSAAPQWCACGFVAKDPYQAIHLLHFHGHHMCRACVGYWLGRESVGAERRR